jgi:hypothetical protein
MQDSARRVRLLSTRYFAIGAVTRTVTGGKGRFAGARGLITSSFAVSPDGLVVDHHWARLFLPSS